MLLYTDDLIQFDGNGVKKYKVIDAKTSVINDMTRIDNLTSTCTQNQQPIYKMIDGDATAGAITKVEMRGQQAQNAFGAGEFNPVTGKSQIQLETGVEFWVNNSITDFTRYLIRSRIK